jgi:hypothetical protein
MSRKAAQLELLGICYFRLWNITATSTILSFDIGHHHAQIIHKLLLRMPTEGLSIA